MSTNLKIETQNPSIVTYGRFGPFASQLQKRFLASIEFSLVLSFFGPKDIARFENVCSDWTRCIHATHQWKKHCQTKARIHTLDPKRYLPAGLSYKEMFLLLCSRIFDESLYESYLCAKVGPVPPIPEEISVSRWLDPDPCEKNTTMGEQGVWMYLPPYLDITIPGDSPWFLDSAKPPQLLDGRIVTWNREEPKTKSKNQVLRVPITINNFRALMKRANRGDPCNIWPQISWQHGNTRIVKGWIWMRRYPVKIGLSFIKQQDFVNKRRVAIPDLPSRIWFNVFEHAQSGEYPDGKNPVTYARTSTLTRGWQGTYWPTGCGQGHSNKNTKYLNHLDSSLFNYAFTGLRIQYYSRKFDFSLVGVAVSLPVKKAQPS